MRTGAINWSNPIARCGLNDGLLMWLLARGPRTDAGTWFDLCGKNNGTLTNGPTWGTSTRPGGSQAVSFVGTTDYVDLGSQIGPQAGCTVAMWVAPTGTGTYVLLSQYTGGTAAYSQFYISSGGITARIHDTIDSKYIGRSSASSLVDANAWSHVGFTWSGGTTSAAIKVYYNGIQVDNADSQAGTFAGPYASAVNLRIATQFSGGGPNASLPGKIGDVRVYSVAKSAGDMFQLYSDSLAGYPLTLNRLSRNVGYVAASTSRSLLRRRREAIAA